MSSRPQRRKSNLSRLSPADPAPELAAAAPMAAPSAPATRTETPAGEEQRKYRHKVSFYQDEDDTARVRAAILHTNHLEGPRSLSEFVHRAVMEEVRRLEAKYNDGKPWPGVGARELPQGRPMGR